MINDFFDKVYLINLDRRIDRMVDCKNQFDKYKIEYERFSAIDGSKIVNHTSNLIKGEIGCRNSHLNVIKMAKNENIYSILILEDDFELCDNFDHEFEKVINQLPEDWEWLYFGGSHFEEPIKITDNIYRVNKTYTTHAYAIKNSIYDKLIDTLSIFGPADVRFAEIQKEINTYITIPHLIYQRDGYSDIQGNNVSYTGIRKTKMNVLK